MRSHKDLLEAIKSASGIKDPVVQALLVRVATDVTAVQARAAAGENVDREMMVVRATAGNLDEHARNVIGQQVLAWTQGLLAKALGVAIASG